MLEGLTEELIAIAITLIGIVIYLILNPRNEELDNLKEDKITSVASEAATKAAENALESTMKSNMAIQKKDWELYKKDLVDVVNPVTQSVNNLDKKVEELQKERKEERIYPEFHRNSIHDLGRYTIILADVVSPYCHRWRKKWRPWRRLQMERGKELAASGQFLGGENLYPTPLTVRRKRGLRGFSSIFCRNRLMKLSIVRAVP